MKTIINRIKARRKELHLSQTALAERIGWGQSRLGNYESGTRNIDDEAISILAQALDVSEDWLRYGGVEGTSLHDSNVSQIGSFDLWDSKTPLLSDDVAIPFYKDIKLAAGNGFADDINDYNNFKLRFSKATLRRRGVIPENAVCVAIVGNSMEPVLPDNTTIGIDMGDKTIRDGKIYAINHGGLLRVKLLYQLPNNEIEIRSYNNSEHRNEIVSATDIVVIGKVFWWSVLD